MMEEGGVTVCVRVRPLIARENEELDEKGQVSWKSEDCTVSQTDGTRSFVFDRVFHSNNSTKEVYEGVTAPIIKSAVQGYNGTIFAYGQTASGKTYTILGTKDGPGILTMAINDVFNTICRIPDREFLLRISYMEIHNETIQDLLCSNIRKKKSLVVREDINRTIYVEDLNEEVVVSPEEVMSWLKKGEKNRHYGETKMNERSSRSHTIFRMIIESKEKHTSGSSYEGAVMVSHLNFVDLAGSERASQTGAEGIRLKEGCNINRSLFILGQVIKKLCDDQSGGFINYRDSKLTRILQNSLGGNAKTVIICTITPASLEETLSTLQFASTAKKMKNTPKVNEVLDDDALLKRYRNEIEDLKRQLEEVSSYSQTKNQLAQLLEEKNSVQKEQQDRIRALTEMLVTSSSFLREQERKDKKKRRVTWAPGALSQDGGIPFLEDIPGRAKRFKSSLPCLTEMEESVSSDFSDYEDPSSIMPEEEWIPGSKINFTSKRESIQLCQSLLEERNNAVTEQQTIQAKFDSVCLEKERLTYELTELHEKISTHEFMALEKQASEEQEMQLMHEITNLKAIISNAEIYNQDLQQEINSKDMQCKEQEERITALEEHNKKLKSLVEEFRKDKNDTTILIQTPRKKRDEVQELKQSLRDAEAVALDAKKESAFLQSENITLKEKMNQLSDTCNQIEKDLGSYKTQLETGKANYKKMQSDLQKELQYYMQENAKLTSLVEVNNSKGLLPYMELGGEMEDLKNQLNKALDENVDLKEKLAGLSEANSGSDLEILHKEIVEKNDTIALLMSEKEMLLSQVAEKEKMFHEATQTVASKMDLTNDEVMRGHTVAFEELRQPCGKLQQKSLAVAEEDKSMKTQIDSCSNGSLNTSISYNTQEQSTKKEEFEGKDLEQEELLTLKKQLDEAHEKLSEMEELKGQLKAWESKVEAEEAQKSDMTERLQEDREKIRALTQERNDFKQKQEALEKERDQLKEEIQDIVSMRSTKKEDFKEKDLEQEELLTLKKQLDEAHEKLSEMEELKGQLKAWESKREAEEAQKSDVMERLQEDKEKIRALTQERNDFKQKQEALEKERDQLKEEIQDIVSMFPEKKQSIKKEGLEEKDVEQEELLILKKQLDEAHEKLSEMEELKDQLKAWESKMEAEEAQKSDMMERLQEDKEKIRALTQERNDFKQKQEALEKERDQLKEEIQDIVSMQSTKMEELEEKDVEQEELLILKKELDEAREKLSEMKELKDQLKAWESKMEAEEAQKSDMMERLQEDKEKIRALTQERNDFKQKQEALEKERDQLKEEIQDIVSMQSIKKEDFKEKDVEQEELLTLKKQLDEAREKLSEMEELKDQLKAWESKVEAEEAQKSDMMERLQEDKEKIRALTQERNDFKQKQEALEKERDQLKEEIQDIVSMQSTKKEDFKEKDVEQEELLTLKKQLDEAREKLSEMEELKDQLKSWESKMEAEEAQKSDMMERLQEDKEKIKALTQERNDFKQKQEALEKERDQLKEDIQDTVSMNIEAQEGLMSAQNSLKQFQKLIEELKETIAEKDKQISRVKETLEITIDDQKQQILQILQILKLTDNLKDISVNQFQNEDVSNELQWIKEQIATLQQEKVALQHQLEDLEKEKNQYLESNQMLKTKSFDLQQLLQTNQSAENFDDAEQLKISLESQVDVLQKENAELVQKLHSTEEDIKNIGQEKEHLRTEVEVLQAEKDTMTQTVYHLGETLEKLIPMNLELQEQLNEANNPLREPKEMVEEPKGKTIAVDSQTSKIDEELKQKAEDTQLELEKLLAYVKLQEDEVNTQKNLVLEKQQMFQRLEEEFKEETKKLKEKIQYLENNSLELRQLLCLKEEESQQTVEKTKDDEQLRSISESQMEALQREKTELVQTLQSSEENFKYISQEKENLRTEIEVLQTEKDNMIQTVHRLSETIERLVPVNLELQQELREANNSLKEHKEMVEELKEKIVTTDFQTLKIHEELKKKCEHSQLEMEKLLMYVKSHEDEVNAQKNFVLEQQQMFQKLEEESKEETKHLKEKIIKSNEEVNSLTEEKKQLTAELREQEKCVQQLLKEKELLQKERDDLQQITENIKEETQSQLQETFSENAAKIIKLNKEASSLNEEKKQLTAELREQEKCVQQLLKENNLLQKERDDLQQVMENIREETQSQFQEILSENAAKIIKLNEEANSLTEEKKQLTAELREQEKCVQQLLKEKALLQKERDDLQQVTENIKEETQSQLQETFTQNAGKESEMSVQRKMQDCFESLEAKIFRIMEAQKKFPELEKRSEYFIKVSLQIKNQYDSKKALITKWLPDISRQEANNIKRLQIENERISNSLYSLLNKLQYFFACLCDKRKEYYTNVSQYTKELLDERRNQHALLMQMQQLGKPHLEQQGAVSQQFGVSELIQSLNGLTEQISKDISEMEEELGSTEVMLQELERENVEMEQYLERCSDHFDLQGFKATIKQNIEKFRSINQFLQPKAEPYFQARSALEAVNTNYCKEINATLKACKEETKELILQLDVLKKGQKSCSVPNMAVKEENQNLGCKLKATEQDTKNLQLKIQDLESIINEGRKNLQEKEKIISILEMKLKVKASRSEVIKLQAALEEKENCLRNALSERETLKAQVDKGVGLYKEKIEDLTTQLAKADMARMKQSKLFDREMANAKALADHREEQLRKLKEELRKAQQEQDITVMSNKDLSQSFLPITCGGGSGIVQNTHMLVLKSEHAKLEKEYAQLKKEHDLLLTNEHLLKEEIKKWKERAMKRRERALGDTTEEHKLKSPRKQPASSLLALPASPCKESSMQPILPLDTPQLMPSNRQSNFFDNSCLGITANAKFGKTESEENNFKDWLSSEDRGDVSNCKTQ